MGAPARPQAETAEGRWTLPALIVGGSKRGTPGAGARPPPLPSQHAAGRAGPPPCPARDTAVGGRRWVEAWLRRAGCGQRRVERPLSHPPLPRGGGSGAAGSCPRGRRPAPARASARPARGAELRPRRRPLRAARSAGSAAGRGSAGLGRGRLRASGRRGPGRARSAGAP